MEAPQKVKFLSSIHKIHVTLLVNSGCSTSICSSFVNWLLRCLVLALWTNLSLSRLLEKVLACNAILPQAFWFIGDVPFYSDLKILPLTAYDIIIGIDWLETFSPMTMHWQQKWMQIPYNNQSVVLQGVLLDYREEILVRLCLLSPSMQESDISLIPADVQVLIDQFAGLFDETSTLPLSWACDHEIPLILCALRDDIEKQVADTLEKGLSIPVQPCFPRVCS